MKQSFITIVGLLALASCSPQFGAATLGGVSEFVRSISSICPLGLFTYELLDLSFPDLISFKFIHVHVESVLLIKKIGPDRLLLSLHFFPLQCVSIPGQSELSQDAVANEAIRSSSLTYLA